MQMAHLLSTTMVVPEEQVLAVAAVLLLQLAVPEVMVVPEDMVENMVLMLSQEQSARVLAVKVAMESLVLQGRQWVTFGLQVMLRQKPQMATEVQKLPKYLMEHRELLAPQYLDGYLPCFLAECSFSAETEVISDMADQPLPMALVEAEMVEMEDMEDMEVTSLEKAKEQKTNLISLKAILLVLLATALSMCNNTHQ